MSICLHDFLGESTWYGVWRCFACTHDYWKREDTRPYQPVFVVLVIETVSEPKAPGDVEIGSDAGHDVPEES